MERWGKNCLGTDMRHSNIYRLCEDRAPAKKMQKGKMASESIS
jgi:hypothetical protein